MATRARRRQEQHTEVTTRASVELPPGVCLMIDPMTGALGTQDSDAVEPSNDQEVVIINEICEEITAGDELYQQQDVDGSITYVTHDGEEPMSIQYVAIAAEEEVADFDGTRMDEIMTVVNSAVDVYQQSRESRHEEEPVPLPSKYRRNPSHVGKRHRRWRFQAPSHKSTSKSHVFDRHQYGIQHYQTAERDRDTSDGEDNNHEDDNDAYDYDRKGRRRYRTPKKRDYAHRFVFQCF